jgi:hypothetical protein
MTSMTDITEPKRIRQKLTASYERFTTVLESLDSAVSVVPLGSHELLFANKLYRLWFGMDGKGHEQMLDQCEHQRPQIDHGDAHDPVDMFVGMPTNNHDRCASRKHRGVCGCTRTNGWKFRSRYVTWVDGQIGPHGHCHGYHCCAAMREELAAQQSERAEKASRLITMGEMASSVAHELNQPLTAISNYCSGMMTRLQKQQIMPGSRPAARFGQNSPPGPAGGTDCSTDQSICETQRTQSDFVRCGQRWSAMRLNWQTLS